MKPSMDLGHAMAFAVDAASEATTGVRAQLLALAVSTLRGQPRSGWLVGIDALVL
eukprot:CAMPEP_0183351412 /NCGR_PEP_ID=MMETSP0164_2-20130417/24609_1 /TAXON_ID=221442 /ORGANISM="Coccolithus pelagicus ssp braarudi, Strain PLY182g" /LENGTH=54 /DNA_ID=CAMNT_0025523585 /DNA_START=424 /DNA_END=589 /DNA_ORIENTATION=+